uniref:DUF6110 family protein n=1 Tax=Ndongobacter massiliensis TaxID=1871025 RepID=UPI000931CC96|nr:DUF6110 family protein [Ndongobacter massiliensis]
MKKKVLFTGLGFLAGILGSKIAKSDMVKKLSVQAVSQGLKAKESVDESIECIKENFDDVVAEAKEKNAKEAAEKRAKAIAEDIEASAEENDANPA